MTKIALMKPPTSLLQCAADISARKKLIHAMLLDTDRPTNRATVVGCAISATRNYLKLHMSKTLNPLFGNIHAEAWKLWKRFAGRRVAPPNRRRPSIHQPPVESLHVPAEMANALSWVLRH